MRVLLLLQIVALCMSCGPSAAEIKTAKTAHYRGNATEMFREIIAVTEETYKLGDMGGNDVGYILTTAPQWYSPEGGRESEGADGFVNLQNHSVRLELVVELVWVAGGGFMVTVTPKTFQALSGSPQPRELRPDDPNLPGWVHGRVDSLQLDIHKRLQNYVVQ